MELDFLRFFDACDPSKTLAIANPEDRLYYIDFASVRGGKIIEALKRTIVLRSRLNQSTCPELTALPLDWVMDSQQLELVLKIFVGSGLVVEVPEKPEDRYQLVRSQTPLYTGQRIR
ncbi:hypothetical protein MC7420_7757 [Coleofasciculus chthonoplastes PCC 7420]|uniref:Uncharacterized protein n=1 Tax=Coleofasciculus chthonoplastes PCC 7420 TaxID=118168 RepID=B4VJH8_9CYAN|nr:hypothetical protein [Coleofasciculus chthonoplastes]EDX78019.1 hypothetical protein MC7420_7757 [Coleofasciculus chthonoplastes PCC 7420]